MPCNCSLCNPVLLNGDDDNTFNPNGEKYGRLDICELCNETKFVGQIRKKGETIWACKDCGKNVYSCQFCYNYILPEKHFVGPICPNCIRSNRHCIICNDWRNKSQIVGLNQGKLPPDEINTAVCRRHIGNEIKICHVCKCVRLEKDFNSPPPDKETLKPPKPWGDDISNFPLITKKVVDSYFSKSYVDISFSNEEKGSPDDVCIHCKYKEYIENYNDNPKLRAIKEKTDEIIQRYYEFENIPEYFNITNISKEGWIKGKINIHSNSIMKLIDMVVESEKRRGIGRYLFELFERDIRKNKQNIYQEWLNNDIEANMWICVSNIILSGRMSDGSRLTKKLNNVIKDMEKQESDSIITKITKACISKYCTSKTSMTVDIEYGFDENIMPEILKHNESIPGNCQTSSYAHSNGVGWPSLLSNNCRLLLLKYNGEIFGRMVVRELWSKKEKKIMVIDRLYLSKYGNNMIDIYRAMIKWLILQSPDGMVYAPFSSNHEIIPPAKKLLEDPTFKLSRIENNNHKMLYGPKFPSFFINYDSLHDPHYYADAKWDYKELPKEGEYNMICDSYAEDDLREVRLA